MTENGNENNLNTLDQVEYAAIEDALHSIELIEAPPTLARGVIRRLHSRPQLPRFRLLWIDYVLSLFVAGMLALIYVVSDALPPELRLYLRLQFLYWLQRLELDPLMPIMVVGGVLLVFVGFILASMLLRQLFTREEV
jgi:hypothetical protein